MRLVDADAMMERLKAWDTNDGMDKALYNFALDRVLEAPTVAPERKPERKKMSNKEWVDFLSEQFTVSRTSARQMLHGLMKLKAADNFKKQFSGGRAAAGALSRR